LRKKRAPWFDAGWILDPQEALLQQLSDDLSRLNIENPFKTNIGQSVDRGHDIWKDDIAHRRVEHAIPSADYSHYM
jgi:hypothetical protein